MSDINDTSRSFDVLIVGAGPAGIFAALELSRQPGLRVAILDKGRDIDRRVCPIRASGGACRHCQPCAILNGWGGAGAFSETSPLGLHPESGAAVLRPEIAALIQAAYDPAMPVCAHDASHALRLFARTAAA